jgi:hypothetical protein
MKSTVHHEAFEVGILDAVLCHEIIEFSPHDPLDLGVATQDRVFPYYAPNSSIKHSKSDSKDRSQEIL